MYSLQRTRSLFLSLDVCVCGWLAFNFVCLSIENGLKGYVWALYSCLFHSPANSHSHIYHLSKFARLYRLHEMNEAPKKKETTKEKEATEIFRREKIEGLSKRRRATENQHASGICVCEHILRYKKLNKRLNLSVKMPK